MSGETSQEQLLSFMCPITMDVMRDPVVAADGFTYEREAIQDWLKQAQRSPKTNMEMAPELKPNHTLRQAIGEYDEQVQRFRAQKKQQEEARSRDNPGEALAVPLTSTPQQPSSLRTIRPEAVAILDKLVDVTAGINWHPPQIVIIGGENQGKSTTMERLLGLPVFPRDKQFCTRVPIRVQLRRGPVRVPTIARRMAEEVHAMESQLQRQTAAASGSEEPTQVRVEEMLVKVTERMQDILKELNAAKEGGETVGVSLDHEIVVRLQHPTYPEMDLVDLPGLVEVSEQEPSRPEHTRKLTKRYLDQHGDHSMFLVVLDSRHEMNQCTAVNLVREHELLDMSMGILTKCDCVTPEDDDDDDDTDACVAELISDKINEEKSSFVRMGYGWCLLASRGLHQKKKNANLPYLQVLQKVQTSESGLFQRLQDSGSLPPSWGIDHLCRRVCNKYSLYLHQHWAPQAIQRLEAKLDQLQGDVRALGLPFQTVMAPAAAPATAEGEGTVAANQPLQLPDYFVVGQEALDPQALERALRQHVTDMLKRACKYHTVCEQWLLRTLHPLRLALYRPGSVAGGASGPGFFDSFASARRRTFGRIEDLIDALQKVQASLEEAAGAEFHPVAEHVVATLQSADTSAWKLERFTKLEADMKRSLAAGLQQWTLECVGVVKAARQWVVDTNAEAVGPKATAGRGAGDGETGSGGQWFSCFLALQEPQVAGVFNAVVSACVAAFDKTAQGMALPDRFDTQDSTLPQRTELMVHMKSLHSAMADLKHLLNQ